METVSQIPERVCPQEFITTSQISKRSSKLLLTTDLVCTEHEPLFHLKYVSYKRGGSFSAGFNPKYNRLNQVLNPAPCKRCSKLSTNLRKISGCKNLRFIQFIIDEGIQRVTRKQGTGISQDDHLCSSCYMVLRRKCYHPNYSPIKRKRTDKQRKESESKQLPNNHQSKLVSNQAVLHNLLNPCKLMLAMVLDHPSHLCCLPSMVCGQPNLLCYLPLISSL